MGKATIKNLGNCLIYAKRKVHKAQLQSMLVTTNIFETIAMGILGTLPESEGYV